VPNGCLAGQPAGPSAFPPNRIYELSVGYVTGQRIMSLPLGDVGNSQEMATSSPSLPVGSHAALATRRSAMIASPRHQPFVRLDFLGAAGKAANLGG